MQFLRLLRNGAMAVGASMVWACSSMQSPTGTSAPEGSVSLGLGRDQQAAHKELLERRDSLRDYYKAQRRALKNEFEQARADWNLFKKQREEAKKLGNLQPIELLRCEPTEFTGDAEVIGPDGGTIQMGTHRLVVPKGALDHEVLISGTVPVSDLVEVQLEPHGLTFEKAADLQLDYSRCVQPPLFNAYIVYLSDVQETVQSIVKSWDARGLKTVVGRLEHFSRYAVAY